MPDHVHLAQVLILLALMCCYPLVHVALRIVDEWQVARRIAAAEADGQSSYYTLTPYQGGEDR